MRIKKTSNTRAIAGKVVNVASESTTDAYSCDYVNDLIVTDNVTISSLSINSGATVYKTFTIPSKTGYTPIAITPNSTSGGGSSYMVFTPTLEGYIGIYNGWTSNLSNASISLKIIYLKN